MPDAKTGPGKAGPSSGELIARADALVGLLRRNAGEAERLRHLPEETVAALEQAGMFRMLQPIERGGYGSDPATVSRVLTSIASGCGASTWILMIYSSVSQLAQLLGDQALDEIYAGKESRIAGVFGKSGAVLERAEGGFRVKGSGHWPFNSGCRHADWDLLRLTVEERDGRTWPAFAAVPMAELELCDDWDVMGAAGTGSNSVRCGALFIPEHRVAAVPVDVRSVLRADVSAATNCALPLGMARHAFDAFVEVARAGAINHLGYARMGDAPVVQTAIAEAAVDIKLIEGFQQWVLSPYTGGALIDPGEAGLVSAGSVRCFELARGVIERLFALAPSSEVHAARSLQRLLRDIHVFQHQHAMTPHISYELFGRRFFAG